MNSETYSSNCSSKIHGVPTYAHCLMHRQGGPVPHIVRRLGTRPKLQWPKQRLTPNLGDPHLTGGERNKQSMNDVGKWSHWLVHCTCKYLINSVQASPNHRSKVCETSQLVLAAHVHQLEHSSLTGLPWSIRKWLQKKTQSSEVLPKLVFRHVSSLGISWNADNTHLRLHCWDWWIYVNLQNIPTKLAGCTGLWQLGPSHGYLHPFSKEAARVAPCELCRVAETSFKKVQEFRTLWKSRCSVGM